MKVGDKVRLAHFHGSTGDQILAESGAAGVIKSIEEEPEPNVFTRCVEVQWNDGISWHFRHSLILENEEEKDIAYLRKNLKDYLNKNFTRCFYCSSVFNDNEFDDDYAICSKCRDKENEE